MVTTKVIEVCTCDRCGKEIGMEQNWTLKMSRLNINREFDLCSDCEYEFKAFMMNKIHYEEEKPKETLVEVVVETKAVVEPIECKKGEGTLSMVDDIDFRRGLPDKLKRFMQENGFKAKDIAILIDVCPATITRWTHGDCDKVNERTRSKLEKFIKDYNL